MSPVTLSALLQLSSPSLPIGGYSYSQGFEAAVEQGLVHNEASAGVWMTQQLEHVVQTCEAPVWVCLHKAWSSNDLSAINHWNTWFLASRETREVRRETQQMGWSLVGLAKELDWLDEPAASALAGCTHVSLPCAHAACAHALGISRDDGLTAYLFMWLENQIMAAIKTIPLGQVAGQRLLSLLRSYMPRACLHALERADATPPRLQTLAPQFAILAARHETQYSRLFRS
jgi:urease accessory protein